MSLLLFVVVVVWRDVLVTYSQR